MTLLLVVANAVRSCGTFYSESFATHSAEFEHVRAIMPLKPLDSYHAMLENASEPVLCAIGR